TGETVVKVDPKYFRPTEVELLMGDPTKAALQRGWRPKIKFSELVEIMTISDMDSLENNK
ncbi:MAG: GDP-mannose 4,6-dehydratase, partial [Bacteroidetes bacterium]|nr:GDP-mannose 4,6-dehydratase [Bacteroidota bacterium]